MKRENTVDTWINIHSDEAMRDAGFVRCSPQSSRDKSVWTKTPNERRMLLEAKHSYKKKGNEHFHSIPDKFIRVPGKLVIYLKKNKVFPKTTYSTECWQSNIPSILSQYIIINHKLKLSESLVAKYSWNGKTYLPGKLPFWR